MGLPGISDPEDDYGLPKQNYGEVKNPRTDFSFQEYERMAVDLASLTYTAPRAWCVISGAAASAGIMVRYHSAVWGNTSGVIPTVSNAATGTYRISWPVNTVNLNPTSSSQTTSATQFYGAAVTVQATSGQATAIVSAANIITVYTKTKAGTASARDFLVKGF